MVSKAFLSAFWKAFRFRSDQSGMLREISKRNFPKRIFRLIPKVIPN
jgi:hypothetical protein